jgi:hypothetical protein
MRSRRSTHVGQWVRRIIGSALVLALAGLVVPTPAPAVMNEVMDDGKEEVIPVEGTAPPWWPSNWGGHNGSGAPTSTPGGDGGGGSGGGSSSDDETPSAPVPTKPPLPDTLGEGPSMGQLEAIDFECNGPVAPADMYVCHFCSDTAAGEFCVCYDCQKSSQLCTTFYDCTAHYGE